MTTINRNFKLTQKASLPIGFSTLTELLASQGADKFVTSEVLIPFFSSKLTEFYNNVVGNAPQAFDTLKEIADKLAEMGAKDGSIEAMISTIIGTKADISYVDGKLNLKADLSMVNTAISSINSSIQTEINERITDVARVEAIANSKVTPERLEIRVAEVLNYESAQLDLAKQALRLEISQKADETSVVTRLGLKADRFDVQQLSSSQDSEIIRIDSEIAVKANQSFVVNEIASAKIDSRGYTDNHILNLNENVLPLLASKTYTEGRVADLFGEIQIAKGQVLAEVATKATPAQATAISEALVNALRTEMLAIEGIDDAEFARLGALLAQLTALESSDVTGIMALLSQKVAISDVLGSAWTVANLQTFISFVDLANEQIGSGKVLDARTLRHILYEMKALTDSKVAGSKIQKSSWIDPNLTYEIEHFLNESLLNGDHVFSAQLVQGILKVLNTKVDTKVDKKVDKSVIYGLDSFMGHHAILNPLDFANVLPEYCSDEWLLSEKLMNGILKSIVEKFDTKANSVDVDTNKLDKAVFSSLFNQRPDGKFNSTENLKTLVTEHLFCTRFADNSSDFTSGHLEFDSQSDNYLKIVLATEEDGGVHAMNLKGFINYLTDGQESVLADKLRFNSMSIAELDNKVELKANILDVYTQSETDTALELKASNARVLQLEEMVATMGDALAQLRADFDSLTDPQAEIDESMLHPDVFTGIVMTARPPIVPMVNSDTDTPVEP